MEALILFTIFIVLDIAAAFWGIDSRDDINSSEWQRREKRGLSI